MGKHSQTKENGKKKRKIGLKIFLVIVILLAIGAGFFAKRVADLGGGWQGFLAALMGHDKTTLENLDKLNFLLMGESTGSSDTIIVCSYDPKTQKTSMLSIPRDTFVGKSKSNATTSDKINALYKAGQTPEKTMEAVNEITGLEIEKYILVDTKAVVELVNQIEGVTFDVPIDMKYDDYSQNLHIDLKAGVQKLSGEQVEQVVRFRHNNNGTTYSADYGMEDYGRMRTQRELITTVIKETIQFKNIKEIGNIIDIAKKYVKTNMNLDEIKDYIPYVINLDTETIKEAQLPGESKILNGLWFFLYDEEETEEVVNDLFLDKEVVEEEIEEIEEFVEETENN